MALSPTRSNRVLHSRRLEPLAGNGWAQIFLVGFALTCYLGLRILVEGSPREAVGNSEQLLAVERALGLDWEREIQRWVLDHPGWVTFWNGVYQYLYWPSVALALVVLWLHDRSRYLLLRNALFVSAAVGIVIFAVFPASPPRFMPGYVDTLAQAGQRTLGADSPWANAYAAVPSFHVAWPAIAGAVVSQICRVPLLALACHVPAALIAGAVIVTGNHFVLDVIIGLVVVGVAHAIVRPAHQAVRVPSIAS